MWCEIKKNSIILRNTCTKYVKIKVPKEQFVKDFGEFPTHVKNGYIKFKTRHKLLVSALFRKYCQINLPQLENISDINKINIPDFENIVEFSYVDNLTFITTDGKIHVIISPEDSVECVDGEKDDYLMSQLIRVRNLNRKKMEINVMLCEYDHHFSIMTPKQERKYIPFCEIDLILRCENFTACVMYGKTYVLFNPNYKSE